LLKLETIFDLALRQAYGSVTYYPEPLTACLNKRFLMTKTNYQSGVSAIVLAAGLGTRMRSKLPKVMHKIAGRPLVNHVTDTLSKAGVTDLTVVVGPGMEIIAKAVSPNLTVEQKLQSGTGDAVKSALDHITSKSGHVLILFGADPLIRPDTIHRMIARREQLDSPAVVVLGFHPDEPGSYGRLITGINSQLDAIIEAEEADSQTLAIGLCNSGIMAIDRSLLKTLISRITNNNAKGEYYLTDVVKIARELGHTCAYVEGDPNEFIGVDTRADLADAELALQRRLRQRALKNGTTLIDPNSIHLSFDTKIGIDVVIEPFVVIAPGVTIDDNATIRAYSHLEGAHVSSGAVIGPFARLRPGTDIGRGAKVGNFVEVKNAIFESGAKANHLSYVGDARVGAKANIGAGTITCNYDGYSKSFTDIGAGAFIGSNTALIAPIKVGDGAIVGAGSTISKTVPNNSLAITRPPQNTSRNFATKYRKAKSTQNQNVTLNNK
jgi:bifunctional UDP-N-acetylglucosamine pyrophosphorylase/glucosamine-1-phosphate N-acetyltransferase